MRVVIADDAVLFREGLARCSPTAASTWSGRPATRTSSAPPCAARARSSRSSTSACRRRTPTRARAPRARSAPSIPTWRCSCSRRRSRCSTRSSSSASGPRASATCSRTACSTCGDFYESARRVGRGGTVVDPEVVGQLMGRRREHDPLRELTAAGAGGARADGRRRLERGHRRAARAQPEDRRVARERDLPQARPRRRSRTSTAACSPCCGSCGRTERCTAGAQCGPPQVGSKG